MKIRRRTLGRLAGALIVLLLIAGFTLPRLDADRFGARVKKSLEAALGREVEIGKVRLDLFNGPGFSVDRVVIHDDPAAGLEPFAYVESLEARVSFASFWTGQLEFSNLRLVNPSVNLARPEGGQWNITPLLGRTAVAPAVAGVRLPEFQIRGGRINLKLGDTKSIFYLTEVSLDADPPSRPGGQWRIRFEGAPARTDRPAQGVGTLRARGRWTPDPATGGNVDISLDLERSSLGDVIRLLHGHDIGVHGQVTSRARLTGPVSEIGFRGRVEISDVHRWDLLPPYSGYWAADYEGRLDLLSHRLELDTRRELPVVVSVRAADVPASARWSALVTVKEIAALELLEMGRRMGLALPRDIRVSGEVSGVAGYSPESGVSGMLNGTQLTLARETGPELRVARADVVLEGTSARLMSAPVLLETAQPARAEADYDWRTESLDVVLTAASAGVPETASALSLLGAAPVLANCSRGLWKGMLRYQSTPETPGQWSGVFELQNAQLAVDGLASPVDLQSARVVVRAAGAVVDRMRGKAGKSEFSGSYHYQPAAPHPHQLRLKFRELDVAEVESLLAPTLRRDTGFFARALGFGRMPEWLAARRVEIAVEADSLLLAGLDLENLRTRLLWDGPNVEFAKLESRLAGGLVEGAFSASFRGAVPEYRFKGRVRNAAWAGGTWDGNGSVQASGTGQELLRTLRIETEFSARAIPLDPDSQLTSVSGSATLALVRGVPQIRFRELHAVLGADTFEGKGASRADGRLDLEFSSGDKEMRLTGTVSPLRLEPVSARPPGG